MTLLFLLGACEPERECTSDLTEVEYIAISFTNYYKSYDCADEVDSGRVQAAVDGEYRCFDHFGFHPCRAEGALEHQEDAVQSCSWDWNEHYNNAPNGEPVWDEVRWMCM